jgi:peptidyl-prolyl cis-trans isomerase D
MLQNIGDKLQSQKWLAYSVMGVLALIFAIWGAYGIVDLSFGPGNYAAKVNGVKVPLEEVERAWQERQPQYLQLFGGQMDDAQRQQLQDQLLDGFVRNAAILKRSQDLGFRVTRKQIEAAYQNEPAFQVDGKFSSQVAFQRLAAAGVTPAQFDAEQRRSLLVNQLGGAIAATEFLTPAETARVVALETEQREVRYLHLGPEQFQAGPAFEPAAIEAAYKASEAQYTQPESAKLAYAELSLADVAAQLKVTDDKLRERYEAEKDRFLVPETRQARHILLPVEETKDEAALRAQAETLLKRAQGGEDFAKLARENSKDQGSAALGGDLGWADRTIYEAPFADALFAAKQGEVVGPVRTRFGWHLIKLEGVREGHNKTYEEALPEIESELRTQLAADEFGTRQEQLQERLERGVSNLDELVQTFGLTRGEVANFERGAGGAPLGSDAALNAEVFSDRVANQGVVGGPVALGEERLVIVKVVEHRPAKLKPLEEVRSQVVARLTRERGIEQAQKAAEASLARLTAGEDLTKIAAGLKLSAEPAKFYGRSDPELPVEVRDAVFNASRPTPASPIRQVVKLQDGAALLEVTAVRVPNDQEAGGFLSQQLVQRELQRRGTATVDAYIGELLRNSKIEKNAQLLQ